LDRFARVILGYHGCDPEFAEALHRGEVSLASWRPSLNPYDWLGHGIYFWEHAPERARAWGPGGVVGAVIQLGRCLDFTDTEYTEALAKNYAALKSSYQRRRKPLPTNRGLRHELDCLVINRIIALGDHAPGRAFQTVRCPFLEGEPAFPGSGILRESHIQVSVIDTSCILGIFRPNLS
jgi:hypothetical protein